MACRKIGSKIRGHFPLKTLVQKRNFWFPLSVIFAQKA
jgi:hypothetical protein